MKTRLQLFFKWGISFEEAYSVSEKSARKVNYADKCELERAILRKYPPKVEADMFDEPTDTAVSKSGSGQRKMINKLKVNWRYC